MRAFLQPNFGFPSDAIPVAYAVMILRNDSMFKISENEDGGLVIEEIGYSKNPSKADETDNEQ